MSHWKWMVVEPTRARITTEATSSATARARTKMRKGWGTRRPSSAMAPRANATSVAMGMPQPWAMPPAGCSKAAMRR
jgi:hypothetical protein